MERSIMHVDCDKFYASVECLHHPEARDKPVVVGGDPEQRHGIVLTKNEIAKQYGVKTGEASGRPNGNAPALSSFRRIFHCMSDSPVWCGKSCWSIRTS